MAVRVHPGAKRNAITGTHDGALKVSLTVPPTDGRANEALIAFIAETLGVPRSRISLISGVVNRSKTLRIIGLNAAEVEARIGPDLG
jgi:uncharacterized protein (TIGR00251 family)